MLQTDHDEEYDQLIEVTGFKPSTESAVLKLHFENNRKSGGGEIKTLKKDSKTGAVRITFKDQSGECYLKSHERLPCENQPKQPKYFSIEISSPERIVAKPAGQSCFAVLRLRVSLR